MPLIGQIECPYCTSMVTMVTDVNVITVQHHEPYGIDCEAQLRRLIAEIAGEERFHAVFPHDN